MARHSRTGRPRPGFTIVELIVYLAILTVLTALAYPSVARQLSITKLEAAAYVVETDLEAAFSLAARQRRPVTWTVDASNRRYTVRDRATTAILLDRWLSGKDSPWGISTLDMNPPSITIYPNGLASQPATIRLTMATHVRSVSMSRTGLVRVSVP